MIVRERQKPTEGPKTGPNRDCRSHKIGRTGLGPTSVQSASDLRSWTEGRNPPFPRRDYHILEDLVMTDDKTNIFPLSLSLDVVVTDWKTWSSLVIRLKGYIFPLSLRALC